MSVLALVISFLTMSSLPYFTDLTFQVPMKFCSLQHQTFTVFTTRRIHNWAFFHFDQMLRSFSALNRYSPLLRSSISDPFRPGRAPLPMSSLFAFSYCSRGSWGKNVDVVCHSLLQWTMSCQNSPPWPLRLGWPCTAWLIHSLSYARLWSVWSFWLAFGDCGFCSGGCEIIVLTFSFCHLMGEEGLCRLPDGRDWPWEKLGLALVGKAVLSKSLIQLSADGWGYATSLLVVWPEWQPTPVFLSGESCGQRNLLGYGP